MQFTDAEQRFADSPEGMAQVAKARREFEMRNAYMGDRAPQWSDGHTANVVRQACLMTARSAVAGAAAAASMKRQEPVLQAVRDTARVMHKDRLANAWRQN